VAQAQEAFIDGKEALASELIPWIGNLIEQMREGIRIAGGFGAALRCSASTSTRSGGDVGKALAERQQALADWQSSGAIGRFMQKPFGATYAGTEDEIKKQIEFLKFLQRQQALSGRTGPDPRRARPAWRARRRRSTSCRRNPARRACRRSGRRRTRRCSRRARPGTESDKIDADFAKEDEQRAKDEEKMWKQVFKESTTSRSAPSSAAPTT
jgi:hypothetical protein